MVAMFRRYLQQEVHLESVLENAFASFGPSAWIIYSQTGNPLAWETLLRKCAQFVTLDTLDAAVDDTNVLKLKGRISPLLLVLVLGNAAPTASLLSRRGPYYLDV